MRVLVIFLAFKKTTRICQKRTESHIRRITGSLFLGWRNLRTHVQSGSLLAPQKIRPQLPSQRIRQYSYVYAVLCPNTGDLCSLIMPYSNTEMHPPAQQRHQRQCSAQPVETFPRLHRVRIPMNLLFWYTNFVEFFLTLLAIIYWHHECTNQIPPTTCRLLPRSPYESANNNHREVIPSETDVPVLDIRVITHENPH